MNLKKSKKIFVFGSHQKLVSADKREIKIAGQKIVEIDSYQYLGITLDKNLNLLNQFEKTYKSIFKNQIVCESNF